MVSVVMLTIRHLTVYTAISGVKKTTVFLLIRLKGVRRVPVLPHDTVWPSVAVQ